MKLISKYNRVNILATISVLLIGSIFYYLIIRFVLVKQLDNTLRVEEAEIIEFINNTHRLPEPSRFRDQITIFTPQTVIPERRFLNVRMHEPRHKGHGIFRKLVFPVLLNGQYYSASVLKSEEETDDLLLLIVLITFGVIVLLLLILFLANRVLLRKIWNPFYTGLAGIKKFQISQREAILLKGTDIDEFNDLGLALNQMTRKLISDYDALKNFADNASHEMQTPLAIINSKLDLLIQDQSLERSQMRTLQEMYDAVGRMSKLNQSLLLLTKIENKQFIHGDLLDLQVLVEGKLLQLEELFYSRHIKVNIKLVKVDIHLNTYLADILLNNLLSNAFYHNVPNGQVDIELQPDQLIISNTGQPGSLDGEEIFERFKKDSYSQGMGLGLAIARQICESANFRLTYQFTPPMHYFIIGF